MRIDGGGFGTISGNSFQIRQSPVTPSSVSGLTAAEIEQMFSYLPDPGLVTESGAAHTKASQVLSDIADQLVKHVQMLHQNWTGTAAQTAVGSFQQLHETAIGLAQASAKTGAVLTWMGGILPFYKSYQAPPLSLIGHIEAAVGDNPSDKAAQAVLERFNNRLVQANSNLPPEVTKNLPNGTWKDLGVPLTAGPAGGSGAGGAASGLAGGGLGPGGVSGVVPGGSGPGGATGVGKIGGLSGGSHGSAGPAPVDKLAGGGTPGPATPGGLTPGAPGTGGPPGTVAPGGPGGGFPVVPGGAPGDGVPVGEVPGGAGIAGDGVPVGEVPGGAGIPGDGVPVGEVPGAAGIAGDGALPAGAFPGEPGLAGGGEGVVGAAPGDTAVIGTDGMIGGAPGGSGFGGQGGPGPAGLEEPFPDDGVIGGVGNGGFVDGSLPAEGLGAGDSGATGFLGADGAALDGGAGQDGMGLPMAGSGSGRREAERRRQAWMAEDADIWEGPAQQQVPSQIGS
ncbi:MAG TPA: hypothetical protein VMI33_04600 [Streptosporangiaceae bacterium]|nr:hypothetical protein [Streptosporangiaceae bacterium]